jgi:hypothetical protein
MVEQGRIPGHFSVAPLLRAEGEIPAEGRQALLAGRRLDAAESCNSTDSVVMKRVISWMSLRANKTPPVVLLIESKE